MTQFIVHSNLNTHYAGFILSLPPPCQNKIFGKKIKQKNQNRILIEILIDLNRNKKYLNLKK